MVRNVSIAAVLPAPPERLFDMYLDPQQHAAFTGKPVMIAARAGAEFSAFDGMLSGSILHVEPKRLIVQRWRSGNFPADAVDSVLVLTFWPHQKEGSVELQHINVPECDFAGISDGWQKFYFTPWRRFLTEGK
jgi:activator of HSP90 ATPase